MPIRPEHRFFYPIDWPQLSDAIRFRRARGRCEECARPHLQRVFHLGDGRWWDAEISGWRDGQGRRLGSRLRDEDLLARIRVTKVVLAAAHRDHDTATTWTPTWPRSASAVTCCTTVTSISAAAGTPCSGAKPWVTCSTGRIRRPEPRFCANFSCASCYRDRSNL